MTTMPRMPAEDFVRELVAGLADMAGVPVALVHSGDRRRPVAWVRSMACKWLRAHEGNYSTSGIGIRLGIDHSSVIYHLRREWTSVAGKLRSRPIPMAKYRALKREAMSNTVPTRKRAMCRLRELLSAYETSGSKIFTAEVAQALSVSSGGAANLLSRLQDEGRIKRITLGVYGIVPRAKPLPVAPTAPVAILPIAFIRPISKERMMAGR